MKPVKAIILGYGIRGRAYASYAATHPDEFEIAGLADPVAEFPADAKYPTWKSWEAALDAGVDADAVVISLPDRLHHKSCLKALEKGYHVLLEKPIGCTWEECKEIAEAQKRMRRLVLTGYVLRYAPFYKKLREVIASGAIGELTSVHHLAAISYGKAAHAAAAPHEGVNALSAATLGMTALGLVRETFRDSDSVRIHTNVTRGGDVVNVVPDHVVIDGMVRASNLAALEDAGKKFDRISSRLWKVTMLSPSLKKSSNSGCTFVSKNPPDAIISKTLSGIPERMERSVTFILISECLNTFGISV